MLEFVDRLRQADAFREEDIRGIRTLDQIPPAFAAALPERLDSRVRVALNAAGIDSLYSHQAAAVDAVLDGDDIVLVSPTASGKTLCFNLPVLSTLINERGCHALYLYPMKALAHDQLYSLKKLTEHLTPKHAVSAWALDGDTPDEHRKAMKQQPPDIIITNPDTLHYAMLAWNEQWTAFFRSLRFIVLDEAHEYRGYFGINVAYVIRRLLALCASLGSHPQIIVSSATVANPVEHALALTGRDARLVSGEGAGRSKKHFVFINPDFRDFQYENLLLHKLALMAAQCVQEEMSALMFCPTRKFVERLNKAASRELENRGLDKTRIAPYKSGYTAEERREIEAGLKTGRTLVVFSTNALEIGIDMGRLDMVAMVGFPESVMSAWQRAGRAGRSFEKEALVLFIASRNAVDQFYVNNIDLFMNKPFDRLAVNLANEEVVKQHAPCALFELGGSHDYLTPQIVGSNLAEACAGLHPDLRIMKMVRPERQVDLRSIFGQVQSIRTKDDAEIGTISGDKLFSEVYVGAIYDHYGKSWRVVSHGASAVYVEPNNAFHYTNPSRFWFIQPVDVARGVRWHDRDLSIELFHGRVQVTDQLTGYKEYDERTGELVNQVTYQSMSSNAFRTEGTWIQITLPSLTTPDARFVYAHTLEHALRVTVPLAIPCDPYDIAGLTVKQGEMGTPTVYLYDSVKGGIGISKEAFHSFADIVRTSLPIMGNDCCEAVCPRCLQLTRCAESNESLDRRMVFDSARRLLELMGTMPEHFEPTTFSWS